MEWAVFTVAGAVIISGYVVAEAIKAGVSSVNQTLTRTSKGNEALTRELVQIRQAIDAANHRVSREERVLEGDWLSRIGQMRDEKAPVDPPPTK